MSRALMVSLALHAGALAMTRQTCTVPPQVARRDVWSGHTLIAVDEDPSALKVAAVTPAAPPVMQPAHAVPAAGLRQPEPALPTQGQPPAPSRKSSPSPPALPRIHAAASRAQPVPSPPEDDGWLSVEDQLPLSAEPVARASAAPPRDRLVERLLEAERKQRPRTTPPAARTGPEAAPDPRAIAAEYRSGVPSREDPPRDVHTALTRALPEAVDHGDALWRLLPLGSVGSFPVSVRVDDDGLTRIQTPLRLRRGEPLPRLAAIKERLLRLIEHGRFAPRSPTGSQHTGAVQHFEVGVALEPADFARHPDEQGYEPPEHGGDGVAYVYLRSNRQLRFRVTRLR